MGDVVGPYKAALEKAGVQGPDDPSPQVVDPHLALGGLRHFEADHGAAQGSEGIGEGGPDGKAADARVELLLDRLPDLPDVAGGSGDDLPDPGAGDRADARAEILAHRDQTLASLQEGAEAALAGIPVIASDLGGLAEYVQEGITGLRFRVGDARGRRCADEVHVATQSATRWR